MYYSFPLIKFSWATDPKDPATGTALVSYSHATQDLLCVFDNFRGNDVAGQVAGIMKVLQRENVLEMADIAKMSLSATRAIDTARSMSIELNHDQLPIRVVYRAQSYAIAIQYNLPDNQIRRLQMILPNLEQFQQVMSRLQALGCALHNSAPITPGSRASVPNLPPRALQYSRAATKPASRGPRVSAMTRSHSSKAKLAGCSGGSSSSVTSSEFFSAQPDMTFTPTGSLPIGIPRNFNSAPATAGPLLSNTTSMPSAPSLPEVSGYCTTSILGAEQTATQNRPISKRSRPSSALATISEVHDIPWMATSAAAEDRASIHPTGPTAALSSYVPQHPSSSSFSTSRDLSGAASFLEMTNHMSDQIPPRRELPFQRPYSAPQHPKAIFDSAKPSTSNSLNKNARSLKRKAVESQEDRMPSASDNLPLPSSPPRFARLESGRTATEVAGSFRMTENLAGFADLPEDKRHSILEDAIIQCLKDDNFIQMCDDFESMWQRLSLASK